jgi:hypothetical protein
MKTRILSWSVLAICCSCSVRAAGQIRIRRIETAQVSFWSGLHINQDTGLLEIPAAVLKLSQQGFYREAAELIQGSIRSWGQPAFGLRSSILVEKTPVSKGNPFIVSVIVENISGARVDLQAISAFRLVNSSKTSPESTLKFGSFWCPVNLVDRNPGAKPDLILASPSRLVMEKGASINTIMDLIRRGWDKSISSWWPARDFDSVVAPGKYTLRLDIQVGGGADPQWIRSNEIAVVIGK